ncbi:unnamed protein product [Clonostachys rhizophaga]|uniref:HNH nuclease domain-containing protein n=1 Tax=Clonostachys rhizophaga TaxID=160324 RepID=A0A9N9YF11_9HYPO|nr:unnamed protein product [Clonostachys rhizophaga]
MTMDTTSFKQPKLESVRSGAVHKFVWNIREIKECQRESAEEVLKLLNDEWQGGHISLTVQEYRDEVAELERAISTVTTDLIVLHTSYHEICGRIKDWATWGKSEDTQDWEYLDSLIRQYYKMPHGARRTLFTKREKHAQDRFRADVLEAYDAFDDEGAVWCVITGKHLYPRSVKATQIVRYNVGEVTAAHLFGPPDSRDGHLMGTKNAFPVHEYYEKLFDDGGLVIVPDTEAGPDCWKTQWLYGENEWRPGGGDLLPSGQELHNRPLKFKNDFRPAARYLYFAYCMDLLRRQRHEAPGWWKGKGRFNTETNSVWATPGDYMRTSALRMLARRIGHLEENEALAFSGESAADIAGSNERADSVHSDIASQAP